MKFLLLLLVILGLGLGPFVWLRRPWALVWWRRLRLVLFAYVIAIAVSAVVWLVTGWDTFYG